MSGVDHIAVTKGEAGARLDRWFKRRYPSLSHARLEKLLRTGQVRVDGARAKANQRIEAGQTVRVPPLGLDEAATPQAKSSLMISDRDAEFIRSLVIYEDEYVIVLNKPPGLAVQGGSKTTRHVDGLAPALTAPREPPRLAHRLDKDTSGVLLLGKTPAATAKLAKAFQSHRADKIYWAVTLGAPTPARGEVKGFVRKGKSGEKGEGREIMVPARHGEPDAVHARTTYAVIARAAKRAAWVALRPETGRTHQLRLHMSLLGTSIAGDGKYRCDREPVDDLSRQLHLHARAIRLPHPSGKGTLEVRAALPKHMAKAFALLGFDDDDPAALDPFESV